MLKTLRIRSSNTTERERSPSRITRSSQLASSSAHAVTAPSNTDPAPSPSPTSRPTVLPLTSPASTPTTETCSPSPAHAEPVSRTSARSSRVSSSLPVASPQSSPPRRTAEVLKVSSRPSQSAKCILLPHRPRGLPLCRYLFPGLVSDCGRTRWMLSFLILGWEMKDIGVRLSVSTFV